VVQHQYQSVFQGEPSKSSFELIAVDDGVRVIRRHRFVNRQQAEVGRPEATTVPLGVAGAHEEPIRPGLKSGRIAQLGKVSPDV
jgi:hypothetical protein